MEQLSCEKGLSGKMHKMNLLPQLLLLIDCGRYDKPRPCFVVSNTSPTVLEMFIIVINILSGSGN